MLAKTDDERIWMLNPRLLVKGDIIVKARLMSKYDSLLGRPLSDWIITDSNGNDPLFLPIEYPTPESLDTAKSDFIKVYHLFFETLSGLGGKESEVLNFLVCAMRNSDNTYTGPMKKIAENVNCSKATVQRAMDTLTDKGFVAMEFDCVCDIGIDKPAAMFGANLHIRQLVAAMPIRLTIQHFRGGKLHFVIQTADGLTFGEHDFGTALFLDLFSHFFDAPCCKFGASVHRRKRKITCALLGQTSVPHFPKIELKRAKFGKSGISVCLLENLEFLLAS